jgi:hypothetical protein
VTPKQRAALETHSIRPGEVRNPAGRNQYSTRRDFERAIASLLGEPPTNAERCSLEIPASVRAQIRPETTRGELLARVLLYRALEGDERMLVEVLARVWPKTDRHEVAAWGGADVRFSWQEPLTFAEITRIAHESEQRDPAAAAQQFRKRADELEREAARRKSALGGRGANEA